MLPSSEAYHFPIASTYFSSCDPYSTGGPDTTGVRSFPKFFHTAHAELAVDVATRFRFCEVICDAKRFAPVRDVAVALDKRRGGKT